MLMVWISGHQGTLAPALVALFRQADARWPHRSRASDGTIGDTAHASRASDHNPLPPNPPGWVDAADLTEDFANGPDLPAMWNDLIARRDRRVKYLIYEGRIVKSYRDAALRPPWVPQPYTGLNAHRQHLHISVTAAGRMDTSPWWPAVVPAPQPTPPPEENDDMPAPLEYWRHDGDFRIYKVPFGNPGKIPMFDEDARQAEAYMLALKGHDVTVQVATDPKVRKWLDQLPVLGG